MKRSSSLARVMGHTAMIALMTAPAFAQDVIDLQEITVDVVVDDGTGPAEGANPATLSGTKTAAPLTEVPQSVSVVGSDTLIQQNARKVDEALAYTPGVQAAPYGYDSDTNWFFVRGFAATATGAFVDGLQNFSYGFGGFYVDPYQLERVEVVRGASSALYGGSNPGGLVNMTTKRPTGEETREVETGIDSDGGAWVATDINTTRNGVDYRLTARAAQTSGNGVFEDGYRGFIAPSATFQTANGELNVSASYTNIQEDHVGNSWLPYVGTVEEADFGYIARDFNSGEPGYDWYDREQFTLGAEYTGALGEWALTSNNRFSYADVSEGSVYAYGYNGYSATPTDADNTLSRIKFDHFTETTSFASDNRIENTYVTGGMEHDLMFGLDLRTVEIDQVQSSVAWPDAATTLSASDPQYGAAQPDTSPYADNVINQTQVGLYAQDQIRFGDGWIATLTGRQDWVETTASEDRTSGAAGSNREDSEFSGRVAIAKEMANGWTPYASISTYFLPQIETSSAGADITPETGEQREIGAKWASADGSSFVGVSAFQIDRTGIVQSTWNGAGYDYTQLGEVRSTGFELEANHDFGNGVKAQLALTTMDVEVRDDANAALVGKTPYATIEDQASLHFKWTPTALPALTLNGGVRYSGASWADNANTQAVPAVTLYDAGANYAFNDSWSANLAVTNLADTTYVASCQTNLNCFYGEGRNVSLAVRHSF
ncbi:TonB-dependent siderophore receptor [Marivivens donghaensis]|uniref:TonB-dependent siderophore receptor n=1 Tax=Marivivens donghaensis TaxID=1699413 RepID=A0ABX0W315_9RHOB|nr:TonB-dependent siderophore receptor [Marivivens donghaensis]NIY73317.1 TonB-dependent siderophore receptor [Marivivens donghaensis]